VAPGWTGPSVDASFHSTGSTTVNVTSGVGAPGTCSSAKVSGTAYNSPDWRTHARARLSPKSTRNCVAMTSLLQRVHAEHDPQEVRLWAKVLPLLAAYLLGRAT